MKRLKIYDTEKKLKSKIRSMQRSDEISQKEKSLLLKFCDDCYSEGLSDHRVLFYLDKLTTLAKWSEEELHKLDKEKIKALVRKIERSNYSEWTKANYKIAIKKFYRWLRGGEEQPEEVRWIKTTTKNNDHKLPEELLTEEEIELLVDNCENLRDKALVSVMYESGCRIGELLSMSLKHVTFDEYGAQLIVKGKTGMRRVRIIAASPLLANWIENHPLRGNPEAPLWVMLGVRNKHQNMTYNAVRVMLNRLGKKAGIKKKVNPHNFRHSRATYLAKHLTEAQMSQYFGWVQGSDMPSTYVHLSGRDVDSALLKMYGLEEGEEEKESRLKPKRCPRCREFNDATAKRCFNCGMVLDLKVAIELEEKRAEADEITKIVIEEFIKQAPEILAKIIEERGLGKKLEELEAHS
jgi:site-specific recombinase XerD